MVSRRTVRWASIRSMAAAARRCGLGLGDDAPVVLAQQLASSARSIAPGCDVDRELLRLEVVLEQGHRERQGDARRRAPRGSPASQRSTVAPASGRPAASSPVTPNRRRIARSWPTVVEARARAPHAPASASARATRRSSGPQSAVMRGHVWPRRRRPAGAGHRRRDADVGRASPVDGARPAGCRPGSRDTRATGSSDAKRTPRSPTRSAPGTIAAWSASTPRR